MQEDGIATMKAIKNSHFLLPWSTKLEKIPRNHFGIRHTEGISVCSQKFCKSSHFGFGLALERTDKLFDPGVVSDYLRKFTDCQSQVQTVALPLRCRLF